MAIIIGWCETTSDRTTSSGICAISEESIGIVDPLSTRITPSVLAFSYHSCIATSKEVLKLKYVTAFEKKRSLLKTV